MIEIIFLGTSASAPSVERGLSSALVLYRDQRFMVDCGEGTQRQLLRSHLGFRKVDKVLLTHGHLDHILGLGGLASTFARWESIEEISIYGGQWALDRVRDLMSVVLRGGEVDTRLNYVPVRPGPIWSSDSLEIRSFPVIHRGPGCVGYLFEEPARRPFIPELAEALGVPRGPERKQLVQGQAIVLADGRRIEPDDVLGEPAEGVKLVHVGDTGRTDNLVEVCRGADALVIEATYAERDGDMAERFGHLTAARAARLALQAGVANLLLVHISRRYSEREILREAQQIFPNTIVPRDLERYRVTRGTVELVEPD
ncbi:MAG: ribonuclease Z [Anaerolineae bacterium]|jgi:ribonuclease Z|nr:ribonuclease Z [Chloroflexota bacterium]